ncbi:conserved hypothetical protein [Coccidioides posadasii str. Silveira]|uniref:Uncharacterized protein n=2 Tax=Coccidioides posadasii TaxID=199306 RepID=E9DCR8_COCPS|nr:conserved hypothetical protein [Coccidioides posadasii str. Silveira]KMM69303.1 hypothetical protein CPAG_05621 [Coccidioides posadasii RMSCC 3488]
MVSSALRSTVDDSRSTTPYIPTHYHPSSRKSDVEKLIRRLKSPGVAREHERGDTGVNHALRASKMLRKLMKAVYSSYESIKGPKIQFIISGYGLKVHSNKCSENEVLVLEFTQGHGPQPVFEERFA